jgi:arginine-tRNA-protein transferase
MEEWSYWVGDRLVGIGYVDVLSEALSAIYFFHDPREHKRSLGTLNILHLIAAADARRLAHVYLGYYVKGCRSLRYKAGFRSNEVLTETAWETFIA